MKIQDLRKSVELLFFPLSWLLVKKSKQPFTEFICHPSCIWSFFFLNHRMASSRYTGFFPSIALDLLKRALIRCTAVSRLCSILFLLGPLVHFIPTVSSAWPSFYDIVSVVLPWQCCLSTVHVIFAGKLWAYSHLSPLFLSTQQLCLIECILFSGYNKNCCKNEIRQIQGMHCIPNNSKF